MAWGPPVARLLLVCECIRLCARASGAGHGTSRRLCQLLLGLLLCGSNASCCCTSCQPSTASCPLLSLAPGLSSA